MLVLTHSSDEMREWLLQVRKERMNLDTQTLRMERELARYGETLTHTHYSLLQLCRLGATHGCRLEHH